MSEETQERERTILPVLGRRVSSWLAWSLLGLVLLVFLGLPCLFVGNGGHRASAYRNAAISSLRNLCSSEVQFAARNAIDRDGDGIGEYGGFMELSGAVPLPGTGRPLDPPVLSESYRDLSEGVLRRSGYHFAIYLPDAKGRGICRDTTTDLARFDPELCERHWCAYAWPVEPIPGCDTVFFIAADGEVLFAPAVIDDALAYSGPEGPEPDAAFAPGGAGGTITGAPARNAQGRDGRLWNVVE